MNVWRDACAAFRGRPGETVLIGGTRLLLSGLCLALGIWAESRLHALLTEPLVPGWLNGADLFLLCCLFTAALVQMPLRVQTDRQIGLRTGTLDPSDLGFLRLSSPLWLWGRALPVYSLHGLLFVLSWLPSPALLTAAKALWMQIPPDLEGLLPLLGVLHLGILSLAALWMPCRLSAAAAALPLAYLKNPHRSACFVLRDAIHRTKHRTAEILLRRLLLLPAVLLFPVGAAVYPRILAADMLTAAADGSTAETKIRRGLAFSRETEYNC